MLLLDWRTLLSYTEETIYSLHKLHRRNKQMAAIVTRRCEDIPDTIIQNKKEEKYKTFMFFSYELLGSCTTACPATQPVHRLQSEAVICSLIAGHQILNVEKTELSVGDTPLDSRILDLDLFASHI